MAIERPGIDPNSTERKVIDISNHIFTVVFTIEMCIKVSHSCVDSFVYTPQLYNQSNSLFQAYIISRAWLIIVITAAIQYNSNDSYNVLTSSRLDAWVGCGYSWKILVHLPRLPELGKWFIFLYLSKTIFY